MDNIDLTESNLTTITSDSNNAHNAYLCEKRPTKFSYQMHLNFQRKDENGNLDENWNKAVANYAFRQCFYKGLRVRSTPLWWPRRWAWTAKLTTARP